MTKESTVEATAPEPVVAEPVVQYTPPKKSIERTGGVSVPYTHRYPEVRGGICEWCGVKDPNQPSQVQYLLCDHFKNIGELRCSYCDESKDPNDVIYKHTLNIHDHPDNPNKLVVVCDSYECSEKHLARFKLS